MKLKPVGIRKDSGWRIPVFLILTFSIIVATVVCWGFYADEFKYEYLVNNGVEVEATVVDYKFGSDSDGDSRGSSGWYYIWECYYNGNRYWGTSGSAYFTTENQAVGYLGKKFTVTVDPDSSWVVAKSLSEIRADGFRYGEYLCGAIISTCLLPIVVLSSVMLILYPLILNEKIDRSGKLSVTGEVIKTRGLLIYYVKVRYTDGNGQLKEKWSRSWFTRKETKFLRQKKFITVVPYKNVFGVVEEMPIQTK